MKNARQEKILHLIASGQIETQEELAARLNREGFTVTQATVSRDIRELRLRKVQGAGGKLVYTATPDETEERQDRYRRVLRDSFVSADSSLNMVVVHTASGMAMAAAAALDSLGWNELLGCIAGDDTVMAVARSTEEADNVVRKIRAITGG